MNALARTKRSVAVAVVGALVLTLAFAAMEMAQAHRAKYGARLTIAPKFKGDVKTNFRCRGGRNVILMKSKRGPDRRVGRDTTNGSGIWKIRRRSARGRFYAMVTRDVRGGYGHRHTCKSDRSPTIRVR